MQQLFSLLRFSCAAILQFPEAILTTQVDSGALDCLLGQWVKACLPLTLLDTFLLLV